MRHTLRSSAVAAAVVLLAGCATSAVSGDGAVRSGAGRPSGGTPKLIVTWQTKLLESSTDDNQVQGGSADDTRLYMSTIDGEVFALALAGGKVLWRKHPSEHSAVGAGVAGGAVFSFDDDNGTSALDPDTGRTLWTRKTFFESSAVNYDPPYAAGVVALKDNTGIVGIAPRTGSVRWTVSRDSYTIGNHAPVTDGHTFYAVLGDITTAKDSLAAIDASTGKVAWQTPVPDQKADYTVYLAGRYALLIAQNGYDATTPTVVTAIDTSTHKIRWTTRTTGAEPNLHAPLGTPNSIVFVTDKGLQGLTLRDGTIAFDAELEDGIGSPKLGRCGDRVCTVAFQDIELIDDVTGHVLLERKTPGEGPANPVMHSNGGTYIYTPTTVYSLR